MSSKREKNAKVKKSVKRKAETESSMIRQKGTQSENFSDTNNDSKEQPSKVIKLSGKTRGNKTQRSNRTGSRSKYKTKEKDCEKQDNKLETNVDDNVSDRTLKSYTQIKDDNNKDSPGDIHLDDNAKTIKDSTDVIGKEHNVPVLLSHLNQSPGEHNVPELLSHLNRSPGKTGNSVVYSESSGQQTNKMPVLLSHLNQEQQVPVLLSHLNQLPVMDKQRQAVQFRVDQIYSNLNIDAQIQQMMGTSHGISQVNTEQSQIVGTSHGISQGNTEQSQIVGTSHGISQGNTEQSQIVGTSHGISQGNTEQSQIVGTSHGISQGNTEQSQIVGTSHGISQGNTEQSQIVGTSHDLNQGNPKTFMDKEREKVEFTVDQICSNLNIDAQIQQMVGTSHPVGFVQGQITMAGPSASIAYAADGQLKSYDEVVKGLSAGYPIPKKEKEKKKGEETPDIWPKNCSYCEKSIATPDKMNIHLAEHRGYPIYTCEFCNKQYLVRTQYQTHRKSH